MKVAELLRQVADAGAAQLQQREDRQMIFDAATLAFAIAQVATTVRELQLRHADWEDLRATLERLRFILRDCQIALSQETRDRLDALVASPMRPKGLF